MAQLARCPACYSEIELPTEIADGDLAGVRAMCPACDETFLLADAKPRIVKQAVLVHEPAQATESEPTDHADAKLTEGAAHIAATIDNPTLAAFLGLDKVPRPSTPEESKLTDSEVAEPEATESDATESEEVQPETDGADESQRSEKETTPAIDMGDFQSLDELFKSSARRTTEPATPSADVASYDEDSEIAEEPSPVADRLRPTLGEMLAATDPTIKAQAPVRLSPEDDLEQDLDDYLDEVEHLQQGKTTVDELDQLTLHDAPVPTFADVDSRDDVEVSKSLRAAMGFVDEEPLLAEDSDHELVGVATGAKSADDEELSFAQVAAPRGTVATRKRKSPSMLRTMFGVVMGGVTGIVGGYLALLWIFHFVGRTDDPLDVAKFYPNVVKPAEFRSSSTSPLPIGPPLATDDDIAPLPETFGEPAEIDQANFETETPAEPEGEVAAPTDALPEAWDDPEQAAPLVQPVAGPATKIVIEGAPAYTAAEVHKATEDASAIAPDLVADGPLDLRKGTSYATLAKLADAMTFGEGDARVSWKTPARELFPQLFATPATQENIAKIAGYWITSPNRSHGGIFFSGTPDAGRQQGSVAEYQWTLPTGQVLTVLAPQPIVDNDGSTIVVVGSLVRDPATHVEGYTGSAEMAVWSEHLLPMAQ